MVSNVMSHFLVANQPKFEQKIVNVVSQIIETSPLKKYKDIRLPKPNKIFESQRDSTSVNLLNADPLSTAKRNPVQKIREQEKN